MDLGEDPLLAVVDRRVVVQRDELHVDEALGLQPPVLAGTVNEVVTRFLLRYGADADQCPVPAEQ